MVRSTYCSCSSCSPEPMCVGGGVTTICDYNSRASDNLWVYFHDTQVQVRGQLLGISLSSHHVGSYMDQIFFSGEMLYTCPFTPDRETTTDQNTDTTEVQLGEPITGIWVKGYLKKQKWLSCITKAHPSIGDTSQKLGTWSSLHSLQSAYQVAKCPFQVTQFV